VLSLKTDASVVGIPDEEPAECLGRDEELRILLLLGYFKVVLLIIVYIFY
jgi:hypothetical protein